VNFYAIFAQGFKSGGFAAAPVRVEDTSPLKPEKATNLEVGMKADLSNRVRINAAIFHTRYHDLQIQSFGPPSGCVQAPNQPNACFGAFETFNAGDAVARGAEVEALWLPTDRISLSLSYGYLDAKFINLVLPNADYPIQSGHDMFRAPRNKAHLELKYLVPLNGGGKLEAKSAYSYTSNQRAEVEPYAIQPAFGLLDANRLDEPQRQTGDRTPRQQPDRPGLGFACVHHRGRSDRRVRRSAHIRRYLRLAVLTARGARDWRANLAAIAFS
jgi:iron complex outermembrane recepter protein